MRLNQHDSGTDPRNGHAATTGDLDVNQTDLSRIGSQAHTLNTQLWDEARLDDTSVDKAASDLTSGPSGVAQSGRREVRARPATGTPRP
ncbi:hypothetical protein ABZ606_18610 [Streptomyces sp. NPDC012461]|jgi:hypothetical protein|uniref:hypothetical protein n=1 Tax=unclassified Streptomyces TaxID=2593676 RepID=UPI0019605C2E|nr:hypothetical protein [Streptomyces sp. S12]